MLRPRCRGALKMKPRPGPSRCWTGSRAEKRRWCPLIGLSKSSTLLLIGRRRGRITSQQLTEFIGDLAALPIRLEPPPNPVQWPAIVTLAERYRLTAYDAAYLELAQRVGLPLATLDGDLRKAAQAEGAALVAQP